MSMTFDLAAIAVEADGSRVCHQFDTEFSVNMANGNAFRILDAIGIEGDYCGTLSPEKCAELLPKSSLAFTEAALKGDSYEQFRILALIRLFKEAISRNCLVSWS